MEIPRIPRTGLQLRDIAAQAFRADRTSIYTPEERAERTPIQSMLDRSQAIDTARQYLPSWLGGYSEREIALLDGRRSDPVIRERTLRVGDFPGVAPSKNRGANAVRRFAQAGGALAADTTSQGGLNVYWLLNAPQAAASVAGQQAMHGVLGPGKVFKRSAIEGAPQGSPFSRQHYTMTATFPLILGASAAAGNLFRQPGYTAVLPGEGDRRETDNPVMEQLLRAVGMTGRLLPYDEFVQERPDVSRGEYEAYKAYQYGSPMPLKFNADGIHGPEVNIIGKSIPLLTGVLPVAAGAVGGAVGLRMAGKRLARGQNQFLALKTMGEEVGRVERDIRELEYRASRKKEKSPAQQEREAARREAMRKELEDARLLRQQQLNKVEDTMLLGAIGGSTIGLGVTAVGAYLAEQIRRARNLEENRRLEQQAPQEPPAGPA